MNIKKIENLLTQIEKSDVVQVDDSPYLHSVEVDGLVGGIPDNEVLMINWHDDEGQEFMVKFTEEGLDGANFRNNLISLEDHEGEPCMIRLFNLTDKVVVKDW